MIIVNPEKTYLVNFNNVCQVSLAVDEEETEYAIAVQTVDKEEIIMGTYKTEERAKEVLDWIVTCYTGDGKVQNDGFVCMEMPKE